MLLLNIFSCYFPIFRPLALYLFMSPPTAPCLCLPQSACLRLSSSLYKIPWELQTRPYKPRNHVYCPTRMQKCRWVINFRSVSCSRQCSFLLCQTSICSSCHISGHRQKTPWTPPIPFLANCSSHKRSSDVRGCFRASIGISGVEFI
jgi:hypothetical protein